MDDDILRRCREGDRGAWRVLVERHQRLVYSIARREGLDAQQADDLTQTVFLILLRSLPRLRDDVALVPWLGTVTRRHAWRMRDRVRREVTTEHSLDRSVEPDDRADVVEWIHQGLERLGARCQALVTALYLSGDELPYAQIAEQLSMPVGSIGPTRARCLAQLRRALEELEG